MTNKYWFQIGTDCTCYKVIGCQAYNPEYNLSIHVHSKLTTCGDLYSDIVRLNVTTQAEYHSSIDVQGGSKRVPLTFTSDVDKAGIR